MAEYPDDDLEVTFEAAFGADATTPPPTWTWTDLSALLVANPITINRGVLVGQGSHRSASTTITALNDDGALTPMRANSLYSPYVDVGTPARLRLRSNTTPWLSDTFTRTSGSSWGTADSGQVWASSGGLSTNGSAGQFTFPTVNLVRASIAAASHRNARVRWDAALSVVSTGASHVCGATLRDDGTGGNYIWASLEFGVGGIVRWTIRSIEDSHEVIEQQVTQPGLTYTAGQQVRCEVELIGDKLQARAWLAAGTPPDTWACSVQLTQMLGDTASPYVGMRGWCVAGNTNTLPTVISVDNLTFVQPRYPRIEGYITDVRPTFQPLPDGSVHSVVQIDIGGIGSRLEKRDAPELTPLRRSLEKSAIPPKIYWPCEDGQGALQAASAFPGGSPMIVNGPAVFSFDTGETDDAYLHTYGTQHLCSVAAGASLLGLISPAVGSSAWTVSALIQQYTPGIGGGVTEVRMYEWATPGGTFARWALVRTLTGHTVRAYNDAAGTSTDVCSYANGFNGLIGYDVTAVQSGGNINITFYANANPLASGSVTGTLTGVGRVTVNPDKVNTTASVDPFGIRFLAGHVMVHDAAATTAIPYYQDGSLVLRGDQGWGYEYAHRRFGRLCTEERVPYKVVGNPYVTGTTQLNVQQPGAFTDLVTASIEAESGGLVVEDGFGYAEISRSWRYNRPVDLTVDMATYRRSDGTAQTDVLVPKLDARGPNYWTVKRTNGSEATAAAPAAFRNRRGTITASATLDVLYDADTAQHAGWRVHVYIDGNQANYPSLPLDLAANPALIDDYLALGIGSRVQRTNQPTVAGYGVIDQVVDQMSETFTSRTDSGGPAWTATLDTSPATVWQVGVFDTQLWDSSSTTLATNVTSSGLVIGFSTALKGDAWSTTDSPIAVTVSGQATSALWMSGIGSVALLEGGFETGITGWQSVSSTITSSSAFARTGTFSLQQVVTGSPASVSISPTTAWPVSSSVSYTASAWVYSVAGVSNARMSISWYTGAGTFINAAVGTTTAIPAGVWTQLTVTATAPGTAGLSRPGPGLISSPATGTTIYIDDVDMTLDSAASGAGPYVQNAWVVRDPVITGALDAGSEIHVADPLWWSL